MEVTSSSLVPLIWLPSATLPGASFSVASAQHKVCSDQAWWVDEWAGAAYFQRLHSIEAGGCSRRNFCALVAQLDRASDYGSEGWGFEFLQAHGRFLSSAGRSVAR